MAKVVPEPVSYTTPEDVKEELVQAGEVDDNQVIMTYEVNSSDLNNYEKIKNYNPGKANPFSSYQSPFLFEFVTVSCTAHDILPSILSKKEQFQRKTSFYAKCLLNHCFFTPIIYHYFLKNNYKILTYFRTNS